MEHAHGGASDAETVNRCCGAATVAGPSDLGISVVALNRGGVTVAPPRDQGEHSPRGNSRTVSAGPRTPETRALRR